MTEKMLRILILMALLAAPAAAQQQPDPAFLQHALDAVAAQRERAMNETALERVKVVQLQEALAKAQARIKELEAKAPASEPAK